MISATLAPKPALLSLGEIVWDLEGGVRTLGGAPFNVAAHAARLGFDSGLISAIGDDESGREARNLAERYGVNMSFTRIHPTLPTGIVDVYGGPGRKKWYTIRQPSAWSEPALSTEQLRHIRASPPAWLICGTLQQTAPMARALRIQLGGIPLFYDVNRRDGFEDVDTILELLRAASIIKCNEEELDWISGLFNLDATNPQSILSVFQARMICVTLDKRGSMVATPDRLLEVSAPEVNEVSSVGAGDAFSAALLYGLTTGMPLRDTVHMANALGALVASRDGAIPDWAEDELMALMSKMPR